MDSESTAEEPLVLVARARGVVTVTLNRPGRKNAITGPLVEELIAVLEEIARTPADRALVLTGAAGAFCSGMDLAEPLEPDVVSFMRRIADLCTLLHDLPRPTLAAVSGPAVGFGANLALCCDLVLACEDASFGQTFANLGVTLDGGGSWSLPRLVGLARAKELAFFAQTISGTEAAQLGLVNRAVPADTLGALVAEWAQRLADGPTPALVSMKGELNTSFETSFRQAVDREALAQSVAFRSPEAKEGGRAYAQRRPPQFRS